MTFRHLKIFIKVYQTESITRAAEAMHMTQPTITRAIQELENHYSRQLFERIHRRLYVTEAGKQLYNMAVRVVSSWEQLEDTMKKWDDNGVIRVGAGITLGCTLLPRVLSDYHALRPQVTLRSIVTDKARLQNMLLHNEIEFALIEGEPDDPLLKKVLIGTDRMVLIVPASHPLCDKEIITIQDIAKQPIIVTEPGSASRIFLENLFSVHGMHFDPVMENESMPGVIQAVRAGIGISMIPQKMVALHGSTDTIKEKVMSYEVLTRNNYIVWNESKFISSSFEDFINIVKARGAETLEEKSEGPQV